MSHYSQLSKVVIDVSAAHHAEALTFWQGAIGGHTRSFDRYPEYHGIALPGQEFEVLIQQLQDGESRVHLDIHTDDLDAELVRLEGLGAVRVQQAHAWWIMRDPAGLSFCVIPVPPGSLTDDNAQLWE